MQVRIKRGRSHPDFATGRTYVVLGIEAGDLRILGDGGRPYLYSRALFEVVDDSRPADWITSRGDDGEEYAYPRALARTGFFEDFFEGKVRTVSAFWRAVNDSLAHGGAARRPRARGPARAA